MITDLLHNKTVRDTVTEGFICAVLEGLVPRLTEKHGGELTAMQMYDDFLQYGLKIDGVFHYPLSLVKGGEVIRQWIYWDVSDPRDFADGIPFSYMGEEPLFIGLCEEPCTELDEKLKNPPSYFEGGYVKMKLQAVSDDKTFLSGKCSQAFVDELNRQLSDEISEMFSIDGIEESTLTLMLVFAPRTYMEHVSEGVTYRRLLISAKGCSARDLWIKWRSKNGTPVSVSDDIARGSVEFSIAEDVPVKIKEKEYRHLISTSADDYQYAMGRKNVTEWRDLVKRIIKRGEVELIPAQKLDMVPEKNSQALAVSEMNAEAKAESKAEIKAEMTEKVNVGEAVDSTEKLAAEVSLQNNEASDIGGEDSERQNEIDSLLKNVLKGTLPYDSVVEDNVPEYDNSDLSEILRGVMNPKKPEDLPEEGVKNESVGDAFISSDKCCELADEIERAELVELKKIEKELDVNDEQALRKKLEDEIRARLEAEAKEKAEEYERRAEELRKEALELQRKNEDLANELQERKQMEMRERERFAESVRKNFLEQQRLEKEREEAEQARLDEERRRIAEEELRKREEAVRLERERIEQEMRVKAEAEAEHKRLLEEERLEREKALHAPGVAFVSKKVRMLFRNPVDSGITKKIYEIFVDKVREENKEDVLIKISASVSPDRTTVELNIEAIPENEIDLLVAIIKKLGNSGLGITRAFLE